MIEAAIMTQREFMRLVKLEARGRALDDEANALPVTQVGGCGPSARSRGA